MKKRCSIGKNCKATCIERSDVCLSLLANLSAVLGSVRGKISNPKGDKSQFDKIAAAINLSPSERAGIGRSVNKLRALAEAKKKELRAEIAENRKIGGVKAKDRNRALKEEYDKIKDALAGGGKKTSKAPRPSLEKEAKAKAVKFDKDFVPLRSTKGSESDFNWESSITLGKFGGKGAFGTVLFIGGNVVKRGEIGENEMEAIKKVGSLGIGPSLIYGEKGKKLGSAARSDIFEGRIAMTQVPGKVLAKFSSPSEVVGGSTVADIYWKARAELHRGGIAHNDAHHGNILIDNRGVGRFVDMGFAQLSPKAAFSEAVGAIISRGNLPIGSGPPRNVAVDVQARNKEYANIGFTRSEAKMPRNLRRMFQNLESVKDYMLNDMGLSPTAASIVLSTGIKKPLSTYGKGAWAKVSDKDAQKLIELLYEGV